MEPLKLLAYLVFGLYAFSALWLLLNGLVQLHLLWHYKRSGKKSSALRTLPEQLPHVSIQIPVYNERYVIARLLDTLAQMQYPKNRYDIQVLDDSTDESSAIIDTAIAKMQNMGIDACVMRRSQRTGFKAGALQAGLPHCKGDLIAIFDADFTPSPQFLNRLVPYFEDSKVGLVQARWSHLNQDQNALTRIQTYLLDTHFSVEQTGRSNAGYFINFCGTAGIWRKQCIEDAGGWDGAVLSEDLDLSYRAQLKGWKMIYDSETAVPAELPSVIEAFKVQQFRWTKGMAQISKKNLRALVTTALPFGKKVHGIFHLLSSFVFVCLFFNAVLTVPLLVFRNIYPEIADLSRYTVVTSINLVALTFFYYTGTATFTKNLPQFLRHYPLFLVVYMGLSVQNCCAVLQGFFGNSAVFVRTPKINISDAANNAYLSRRISWINVLELVLLCYFLCGIGLSVYLNDYFLVLFFVMIVAGLSFIIFQSVAATRPLLALRSFLS